VVLRYHNEQPIVQSLWDQMAGQLSECPCCVEAYHEAQVWPWGQRGRAAKNGLIATPSRQCWWLYNYSSAFDGTGGSSPALPSPLVFSTLLALSILPP
jgi:hypothetical protein